MAGPAASPVARRQEQELDDLRAPILQRLCRMTLLACWVWIAVEANRQQISLGSLVQPSAMLLAAALSLLARRLPLVVRSGLFLAGLAVVLMPWSQWPVPPERLYLQSLGVSVAALLTGPGGAMVAAGLLTGATLAIYRLHGQPGIQPDLLYPLGLLWATAVVSWLVSRGLYTVLSWALADRERAWKTANDVRKRREELRRTVDSLRVTHGLLERTTRELELARREAETARNLRSDFAANISHELRTPLNIILGFAEIMDRSPEVYGETAFPPMLRGDILEIRRNARHLSDLVDDILDLARLDALRMPIRREPAELAPVVREAAAIVERLLEGKPVGLVVALPEGLPPLDMDCTRIRQVLINLLSNACRFTDEGSVTVEAREGQGRVVVVVRDTGPGIPQDQMEHIFDEYHQVAAWNRAEEKGKGLGLAIAKHLVELHGGHIWAESVVGEGSTFYFDLPLTAKQISIPVRSSGRPLPGPAERPCLLVLEEGRQASAYLRRHLEGYDIVSAEGAAEAAAAVERLHPVAVLVNAPAPDGALSAALDGVTLPPGVPVIGCSLPQRNGAIDEGLYTEVLAKPVSSEQLLRAVRAYAPTGDILVVDDDRGFVQFVQRTLQTVGEGARVRWTYDGPAALEKMRAQPPALVLLDAILPGMGGLEIARAMRSDPRLASIPAAMVSGASLSAAASPAGGEVFVLVKRRGLQGNELARLVTGVLEVARADYATPDKPADRPGTGPERSAS